MSARRPPLERRRAAGVDGAPFWAAPALLAVPVAFLSVLFLWPLATVLDTGLRPDGAVELEAFSDVIGNARLRSVVWFTVAQATASTALTLAVGLPVAWVLGRLDFRGRRFVWSALVAPFVLPTVVVGAAFLTLLGPNGPLNAALASVGVGSDLEPAIEPRGTMWAILLAHVFFNVAVVARVVGGAWRRLDPRVEECAQTLGASRLRTTWEVTAPLLAPAVLVAATVVWLFTFTSFGVVLVLGRSRVRTIEVEVYQQVRTLDLDLAAALAVVQLVLVVAALGLGGRVQRRWTMALPTRPAGGTGRRPEGPAQRWALRGVLAGLTVLIVAPLAALATRSLRVGDDWTLAAWRGLGSSRHDRVLSVDPLDAAWWSLRTALVAATISVVVGGLAAAGIVVAERRRFARDAARASIMAGGARPPSSGRRRRAGAASLVDAALLLPLGTSAVTVGLGFVLALDEPPLDLRGAPMLVPLAQAVVATPFVVRSLTPALRSIPPRLREAAAVLGASPLRVWRHVDAPMVLRPCLAAYAFALAVSLGEFGATVFVARTDRPTLPIVVQRLLGQPGERNVSEAMAVATALVVLTAVVVAAVELLDREDHVDA